MTDYDELVKALREHKCDANDEDDTSICAFCTYEVAVDNKWVCVCGLMNQAADAIEELANKLCDWCGVCPKERRRPWDCEIMWPNAPIPEVYIEPPKEET